MMAVCWDISMTTGVTQVDNEHKELFRQVANLGQAMLEGKGRDEIGKILNFVGDYVVSHFAHEEKFMADYRCPAAEANETAHNQFIAKLEDLQKRFESGGQQQPDTRNQRHLAELAGAAHPPDRYPIAGLHESRKERTSTGDEQIAYSNRVMKRTDEGFPFIGAFRLFLDLWIIQRQKLFPYREEFEK